MSENEHAAMRGATRPAQSGEQGQQVRTLGDALSIDTHARARKPGAGAGQGLVRHGALQMRPSAFPVPFFHACAAAPPPLQDKPLGATMRTVDAIAEACPQALLDGVPDGLARIHQAEAEAAIQQVS